MYEYEFKQTPINREQPKLLDQVRLKIRQKHYSPKTEKVYIKWIYKYIVFNKKQHPIELGAPEIESFLNHLADKCHVSSST